MGKTTVPTELSSVLRYAVAGMAVLAALGVRMLLDPVLGPQAPYLPFIFAVIVASRYGGRGPGLAATALSALAIDYFFLEPRWSFVISRDAAVGLAFFAASGMLITLFMGRPPQSLLAISALRQRAAQIDVPPSPSAVLPAPAATGAEEVGTLGIRALRRKPHLIWFAAATLLLLLIGLFFVAVWGEFSDEEARSLHTREVLAKTDSLFSELQDAEIGQRGYLLTGNDAYQAPYDVALKAVPGQLEQLRRLASDNPKQQERIEELRTLIAAKFAELKETIDLYQAGGPTGALQEVATDRGKRIMDQIRVVIAQMKEEESSLLAERGGAALALSRGIGVVMLSGVVLLLLLLMVGSHDIDRNITRRQRVQQALEESEAQFRTLANAIPQLCSITSPDGSTIWYNQRWYEYTGATPEQLEGWGWQTVHDPAIFPEVAERWRRSLASGEPFEMVCPLRGADAVFRDFLSRVVPVRGHDGKVAQWIGTCTDISEQRKTEEALRQSLERLERVLEVETVGVMFWDLNTGHMVDANDTFLKLMGYNRSDVDERKLTWQKLTPPEYMDVSRREVEKFLATGRVGPYEKEYFRKDGTRHWLLFAGSSLGGNQCVEFCVDIAGRKKAEQALRESEEQFRTLANAIPTLCWMANADGWIFWYNQRWYEYTGTTPKQMEGWGWQSVHDPQALPNVLERWKESIAQEKPFDMVFPLRGADGVFRPFLTRIVPLRDQDGKVARWFGTNTDISEQIEKEQALRASEERFRSLAFATSHVIWIVGPEGRVTAENPNASWWKFTGQTAEQMMGLGWLDAIHPEDQARVGKVWQRAVETKSLYSTEYRLRRHDGEYRWVEARGTPILNLDGSVREWIGTSSDITEQRQAEEALKRQAELLRLSFDAILLWRWDGAIESWNVGAEQLYDFPEREAVGRVSHEFLNTVFPKPWADIRAEIRQTGRWEGDLRHRARGGREVIVSARLQLLRDDEGVERVLEIDRDITDRKRAEQEVLRLSAIVESSEDAIIGKTLEGVITSWSPGATRLYGYSASEAVGQSISMLLPEGHADEVPEILHRLAKGEHVEQYETVRRRKDTSLVEVWLKVSPILDTTGHVVGASTIARDITDRKRAEEEIRRLNAELEERVRQRTTQLEASNKELEAFAYSVSHDLRAPLRGIDGWSLALAEDYGKQLDRRAHEYLGRVRSETQRMGLLIDDLLKLSRATRMEMQSRTVDLTSVAQTIAFRMTEENHDRRIDFTIADGLQATGDARLLEIVLTNLFSNAVKFTGPRDEARIEFGRVESDGECPFYVRDNGVGFDMAFAEALFGAFQRLHSSDEFPGTGIGLATVQRIIQRHGGRVWAEAQPDQGATFYFTVGR